MESTIDKLKNLKNATQEKVDKIINEQSYQAVLKELQEDGIDVNDLTEEEFNQLLAEEIKKQKTFSKGVLVGAGALLLLELLG
jgi:TRAP-type C4-dicarboxylate transport system substrate-binding protein